MRHLVLSVITTTATALAFMASGAAQARVTGEVQAITPCDLYSEDEAPICPQVMVPVKSTLQAIPVGGTGARRAVVLRSDDDGHLSASLPRAGRYRLVLRKVETSTGRFSPRSLRITPNNIRVSSSASPTLFLVSHRTRPTFNVGISYGK
jgi:hypothetical protein